MEFLSMEVARSLETLESVVSVSNSNRFNKASVIAATVDRKIDDIVEGGGGEMSDGAVGWNWGGEMSD